jgi:hypothetical protein
MVRTACTEPRCLYKGELHLTFTILCLRRVILLPAWKAIELGWSNNPENYAGNSVAVCTAFHVGQVKGDDAD